MTLQRRGKNVAIAGAVLQAVFAVVMLVIWISTHSRTALGGMLMLAGGVAGWAVAALLFYCRQLERREALELEELGRGAGESSLFRGGEPGEPRPAAARLRFTERWVVPIFTLLWAAYHVAIAVLLVRAFAAGAPELASAPEGALGTIVIGFLAFLFSRYATGMSAREEWRLLRATGSYLFVCVLMIAATTVTLVFAWQGYVGADAIAAYIAPAVMLIFAAESAINLVLDLYRPRVPGQEYRPAFDSRLFNLAAQPERVGHSLAEAINYQFGFEVSRTWFYRLVSKAFVPLLIFGALVLIGMTSIVIVHEGEEVVVLHWGRPDRQRGLLGPGMHVKWPWPVDKARRFRTGRVHEIFVGLDPEKYRRHAREERKEPLLWSESHLGEEVFLTDAAPGVHKKGTESLLNLAIAVRYRIRDVYRYGFEFEEPRKKLRHIAYQRLTHFAAGTTDIEPPEHAAAMDPDHPRSIMTYGRQYVGSALRREIQRAARRAGGTGLGVEVVEVALLTDHPPPETAEAFEDVIKARLEVEGMRYEAEGKANELLGQVSGEPRQALELALAIQTVSELEELANLAKRSPAEFREALATYIHAASQSVEQLRREVERERLLGKLRFGRKAAQRRRTDKQMLLEAHRHHLSLLEDVRGALAEGREYDFASALASARGKANRLFSAASGEPARIVAEAMGDRRTREMAGRARGDTFQREYDAYRKSPSIYKLDRYLDVLDEYLPKIEKYVLGVPRNSVEVRFQMEKQTDVLGGVTFGEETPGAGESD